MKIPPMKALVPYMVAAVLGMIWGGDIVAPFIRAFYIVTAPYAPVP